jgi:predicted dehydrogenase
MNPVRIGLIGCGVIGGHHLRHASESPLVEVVAVADRIEERVTAYADQYAVATRYREGSDLIDDPAVEAVILALPANGRFDLARQAFAGGKHVIDEKPVAMNATQAEQLIAARGDLVSVCGMSRPRMCETAQRITDFIASGALGELRVINCRQLTVPTGPPAAPPPTWRLRKSENGGGILMNWGCYDLDYVLGITGWSLKPRRVLGKVWTVPSTYESFIAPDSDAETHVTALIACEGGTVVNYERGEYMAARPEAYWQLTGTLASLHVHLTDTRNFTVTVDRADAERGTISDTLFDPIEEPLDGMRRQLDDFALAIRENRKPQTGLEEALLVQQITDAIYASSASGEAVEL